MASEGPACVLLPTEEHREDGALQAEAGVSADPHSGEDTLKATGGKPHCLVYFYIHKCFLYGNMVNLMHVTAILYVSLVFL